MKEVEELKGLKAAIERELGHTIGGYRADFEGDNLESAYCYYTVGKTTCNIYIEPKDDKKIDERPFLR